MEKDHLITTEYLLGFPVENNQKGEDRFLIPDEQHIICAKAGTKYSVLVINTLPRRLYVKVFFSARVEDNLFLKKEKLLSETVSHWGRNALPFLTFQNGILWIELKHHRYGEKKTLLFTLVVDKGPDIDADQINSEFETIMGISNEG